MTVNGNECDVPNLWLFGCKRLRYICWMCRFHITNCNDCANPLAYSPPANPPSVRAATKELRRRRLSCVYEALRREATCQPPSSPPRLSCQGPGNDLTVRSGRYIMVEVIALAGKEADATRTRAP